MPYSGNTRPDLDDMRPDAEGADFWLFWNTLKGLYRTNAAISQRLGCTERAPAYWRDNRRIPGRWLREIREACREKWLERFEEMREAVGAEHCHNCGTDLPEGCGGRFLDDGTACLLRLHEIADEGVEP